MRLGAGIANSFVSLDPLVKTAHDKAQITGALSVELPHLLGVFIV